MNHKDTPEPTNKQTLHKRHLIKLAYCAVAFIIVAMVGGACWLGYKFIRHEQNQNLQIAELNATVSLLKAEMHAGDTAAVEWGDGYNYLAIGNSITLHPIVDYWWQEDGMAATDVDKDYFHIVTAYLESIQENVTSVSMNGGTWEVQTNDRSEVLSLGLWDDYLSDELDLVTIQLSENVSDTTTFQADFIEMVEYVTDKCPNAQIVVIDDFWSDEKSHMKKPAVESLNAEGIAVDWVDLSDIRGKSEYQAGLGTTVYDAEGNEHVIEHSGVAAHPGDKGMEYYAEKIIELIK